MNKKSPFITFLIVLLLVLTTGTGVLLWMYTQTMPGTDPQGGQTPSGLGTDPEQAMPGTDPVGGQTPSSLEELIAGIGPDGGQNPADGGQTQGDGGQTPSDGGQTPATGQENAPSTRYGEFLNDPERMEALNIHPVNIGDRNEFVMDFTGDILFDPGYAIMSNINSRGGRARDGFSRDVITQLQQADITFMNNEFPYSDGGAPIEGKTFTFRARPSSVRFLNDLGVDAVSLANNHAFDYGERALLDTFDTLKNAGISYIGAGRDKKEAMQEICYLAGDTRIAVIAATQIERSEPPNTRPAGDGIPGVFRCWNVKPLLERVSELKEQNDVVIVFIHWGTESTTVLDWAQLEQADAITKAGADVIVGAHPHVLQSLEYVNGVPVAYSLGNFLFNSKTLDTCILQLRIPVGDEYPLGSAYDPSKIKVRVIPCIQQDSRVKLLEGAEEQRVLSYLNSLSSTGVLDSQGFLAKKG